MYNIKNLAPLKVLSKTSTNLALTGIAFYGNRTVGTDSFRLLEVSARGEPHEPQIIDKSFIRTSMFDKKIINFDLDHIQNVTNTKPNPHIQYPNIDLILKEDSDIEYATVRVDAKMFGELLVAMSTIGKYGEVEIKVPINQKQKPIHIYAHDSNPNHTERQTAHGLMMPTNK